MSGAELDLASVRQRRDGLNQRSLVEAKVAIDIVDRPGLAEMLDAMCNSLVPTD